MRYTQVHRQLRAENMPWYTTRSKYGSKRDGAKYCTTNNEREALLQLMQPEDKHNVFSYTLGTESADIHSFAISKVTLNGYSILLNMRHS